VEDSVAVTRGEHPVPQWSRSAVLWIGVLAIMASFQTWRGAYVDGVLFYAIVAMLVIDRLTRGRIRILKQPILAPKVVTLAITGTLALVLVVAPRHGWVDLVTMVAIGVTVLLLAWEPAPQRVQRTKRALTRSAVSWSILGVALCVWEALAFIMSVTMPNGEDYPTVSVLLDPVVSNLWGRIFFVSLWLAGGLALLRFWKKR
jgi:uncharacterized protein with PQ loop repeat